METKRCSLCGAIKSVEEFYKRKNSSSGYCSQCKTCALIRSKEYRSANLEKELKRSKNYYNNNKDNINKRQAIYKDKKNNENLSYVYRKLFIEADNRLEAIGKKFCCKCNKLKPLTAFQKRTDRENKYRSECKECTKTYQKQYVADNKKAVSKYRKQYYKDNKEHIKATNKEYYKSNKEKMDMSRAEYFRLNRKELNVKNINRSKRYAKYTHNNDKLTIDESPRCAIDGELLEVKCRYCGKYFIPTNLQVSKRIAVLSENSAGNCYLYCSNYCKAACPVFNQKKYPKGFKHATSREVQPELRQLTLDRDNYSCQRCGKTTAEASLHCHHILPLNESPIESADIENCIILCEDCHKEVHKLSGCGYHELKCSE